MFEKTAQFKKWYVNTELNDHVENMKNGYSDLLRYKKSVQKSDLTEGRVKNNIKMKTIDDIS